MAISIQQIQANKSNHRRFIVNFFGSQLSVVVTSNSKFLKKWLYFTLYKYRFINGKLVVGLGVQWLPQRISGENQSAATLQLCIGRRCLIFQLSHAERVPAILTRVLTGKRCLLVGLWNHSDKEKLQTAHLNLEVGEIHDMRMFVRSEKSGERLNQASREKIIEEYLGFAGVRFDKEIGMSNWGNLHLSHAQIMQACVDAHAAFLIGRKARIWNLVLN